MRDLWQRLESYLSGHAPAALECLNPAATDAEIRDAEARLGVRFPADFAASLRVHNGQMQETGHPPHPLPFLPQEYEEGGIYRATFGELAPLSLIVDSTIRLREAIEDNLHSWADKFEHEGPVRHDGKWSWLIFVDAGGGDLLGLD